MSGSTVRSLLAPWFLLASLAACLPPIPVRTMRAPVPAARAEVSLCRLDGFRQERMSGLAVHGGAAGSWRMVIGSVLVRHPKGVGLIDPAFGRSVERDLARLPLLQKLVIGSGRDRKPVADLLEAVGVNPFQVQWTAVTHAHYDHTGGLRDLPRARVLLSRTEFKAYRNLRGPMPQGAIPEYLELPEHRFQLVDFDGPPVLAFESSKDLFGDGSVVAVPLPGHTPGSMGLLVNAQGGKRFLFAGDAAWALAGIEKPAHKGALVSAAVDHDAAALSETLGALHAVLRDGQVAVVPAHDLAALEAIPECAPPPKAP